MPELAASIPALLERRAQQQPDDVAYTFIDYEADPAGFAESLTWSDLHQRVQVVAATLLKHGSPGDRAVILAPQSLEYIIGFLGAIQAGFIAVPLPVPMGGGLDERVLGALRDCTPVVVLTNSVTAPDIKRYLQGLAGQRPPRVVEVDALDYYSPAPSLSTSGRPTKVAYLQYTSGSTGQPAGVMISHANVLVNLDQALRDMFEGFGGGGVPTDTTVVSWLPFYHDMGLVLGVFMPLAMGRPAVLMSPIAFLQKPARWIQHLAGNTTAFTAAPNFAYHLAAARTTDEDLAGLSLAGVAVMTNGAERVHGETMRRFNERFATFGLPESAIRPSYGLAEATVYVVGSPGGLAATMLTFDLAELSAGRAELRPEGGSDLVGCGRPRSCEVRIVDPEKMVELAAGEVGEIWVHGEQVSSGYWRNPELTARTFGGQLAEPSEGTPAGPWLRTGDLGVIFDDELYIIGRIKDLLIVDGRNIYPDDIEATVVGITGGRVAAVSLPDDGTEKLVVLAELRNPDAAAFPDLKNQVTAAVSKAHSVRVADVVLLEPGALPITTSGKVRRAASAERYRSGQYSPLSVGP
ncbi:MAG: AMP-binding protein [Mycobacterium sp.]|nr:AMP-binding protein [Mycobacterium sp.]